MPISASSSRKRGGMCITEAIPCMARWMSASLVRSPTTVSETPSACRFAAEVSFEVSARIFAPRFTRWRMVGVPTAPDAPVIRMVMPLLCLDDETVAGPLDAAKAGKAKMRAGDDEPLGRGPVEHALARGRRQIGVDVVDQPGLGTRELHRREVHDVAPDQDALAAGLDEPVGVTRRMSWPQHRGDAGQHLAVCDAADAVLVWRKRRSLLVGVADDAFGVAGLKRAVEPERRLDLVDEKLGLGKHRLAFPIDQPK